MGRKIFRSVTEPKGRINIFEFDNESPYFRDYMHLSERELLGERNIVNEKAKMPWDLHGNKVTEPDDIEVTVNPDEPAPERDPIEPDIDIDRRTDPVPEPPDTNRRQETQPDQRQQSNPTTLAGWARKWPKVKIDPTATDQAKKAFYKDMDAAEKMLNRYGLADKVMKGDTIYLWHLNIPGAGGCYNPDQPRRNSVEVGLSSGYDSAHPATPYLYVLIHELGHRFDFNCNTPASTSNAEPGMTLKHYTRVVYNKAVRNGWVATAERYRGQPMSPTAYGRSQPVELWAECFACHFMTGAGARGVLSPMMHNWVKKCINMYKDGYREGSWPGGGW